MHLKRPDWRLWLCIAIQLWLDWQENFLTILSLVELVVQLGLKVWLLHLSLLKEILEIEIWFVKEGLLCFAEVMTHLRPSQKRTHVLKIITRRKRLGKFIIWIARLREIWVFNLIVLKVLLWKSSEHFTNIFWRAVVHTLLLHSRYLGPWRYRLNNASLGRVLLSDCVVCKRLNHRLTFIYLN